MKRLNLQGVVDLARTQGLKMTPQRRAIIEFLETAENHPTADEVFIDVNEKFPMSSRATVYNTLHWLRDKGLLTERFDGNCVRFDPNIEQHHHFQCRSCGKVEDVGFDLISDLGICTLPDQQTIETFEVTLRGLCVACVSKKK